MRIRIIAECGGFTFNREVRLDDVSLENLHDAFAGIDAALKSELVKHAFLDTQSKLKIERFKRAFEEVKIEPFVAV